MESPCGKIALAQSRSACIRPARKDEWPALVAIWEKAVGETHGFLTPEDFTEIKVQMPQYFGAVELYVLDDDNKPLGFIGLDGDMVEMLFVGERGRGIGRRLLDFAVSEKGAARLDVNEQNVQARGFYEKCGFTVTGRSTVDGQGRPYPLLHMEITGQSKIQTH